jgi:outer membrane protein assembly factor BamB
MRRVSLLLVASILLGARSAPDLEPPPAKRFRKSNWLQFSNRIDDRRTYAAPVTPENVEKLHVEWTIKLPEIVDSAPLYVSNVNTAEGILDMVIVETTAGRLAAYDVRDGKLVWQTNPPKGPRWTTSSPAADPSANFVFAYCLDGRIHRYAIADGAEVTGGGWPVLLTKKGEVEKGSSNIIIATARDDRTVLYMTIAAYPEPGDEGDYQGHLVAVDIGSGETHVFNALCSDRPIIFDDKGGSGDCSEAQAGIWARAAAVYDSVTDRIFLTTGNGAYDADRGGYNWG